MNPMLDISLNNLTSTISNLSYALDHFALAYVFSTCLVCLTIVYVFHHKDS